MIGPLAVLMALMGASVAAAQSPTIDVSPATVPAGGTVTISGVIPTTGDASCPEPDVATLTSDAALFPPDGFGPDLTRDATGAFQLTYVVDPATVVGVYAIGVRCGGGNVGIAASLEVTVPSTSTPAPSSTANAVVTTATGTSAPAPTVIATAIAAPPDSTVASQDDGGRGVRWWVVGVVVAGLTAVVLVAWRGRIR